MATATLERATEVVGDKTLAAESVTKVAASESRAKVEGKGLPLSARAWDARAQVD
jgi:hypothetical protein